jgi:RNA polymerase sigma factor (sigma-70 family)
MTATGGTDSCPAGVNLAAEDDAELLRLVRAGHDPAFGELFARHAAAVRGFALRCCTDVTDAEDMAAEAFFRVLQAVRRGAGPDDHVRAYLLTVVRRLAAEWSLRRRDVPVADDELSRQLDAVHPAQASRADLQLIARAFTTLPQRWRAVLWRVEVEGERPAVVARHFGLSPNATAALARRARQGLQAAYLQAHLAPGGGKTGCRSVVDRLGAFTAGQVSGAEAGRIEAHLAGCPACRALHAELLDVCAGLRRYASALTPPALGAALGSHHALLAKAGVAAGRLAGHVAGFGARMKLVAAAVSMAAVGGVGVAAGPLVAHLDPSPHADRGVVVGPLLLSSTATTGSRTGRVPHGSVAHGSVGGAFDPPPRSTPNGHVAGVASTSRAAVAGASTGVTAAGTTTTVVPASTTETMSMQLEQAQQAATTTDDGAPSTTQTGRQELASTVPTTTGAVGSTSWTTDGTTYYEWWSSSG